MSERDFLELQLGKVFPEDKSLSPIDLSYFEGFFEKRGIGATFRNLSKKELTQELISRIRSSYNDFKPMIQLQLGNRSDRFFRNTYYGMVYAILNHNRFGIASSKGKLTNISLVRFAEIFSVDRKTISRNQIVTDFYNDKRNRQFGLLKPIFHEIETIITAS